MYKEYMAHECLSYHPRAARTHGLTVSAPTKGAGEQWCLMIGSVVVGLLALYFFLWMGGVFALLGPLVILTARLLLTRQVEGSGISVELHETY